MFFTNYGHQWGMKNQCVLFPNGMLGSIFTASMSQNDKGVVNISGVAEELERLLHPWRLSDGILPALYGDDIYEMTTTIVKKLPGIENLFHQHLSMARMDIEHKFGLAATLFKRLEVKHTWKLIK